MSAVVDHFSFAFKISHFPVYFSKEVAALHEAKSANGSWHSRFITADPCQ